MQLNAQSINEDKLRSALTELQQNNSQTNQRNYFDFFPDSFDKFEQTFGYKDGKTAPLYDGHEYIS